MNSIFSNVRLGDMVLVLLLVLLAGAVTWASVNAPAGGRALVAQGGENVAVLRLDDVDTLHVEGPLGTTVIVTDGESVYITSSPCPNHICVHMGRARLRGQTLLCVPNEVSVRVQTDPSQPGVDGVTG